MDGFQNNHRAQPSVKKDPTMTSLEDLSQITINSGSTRNHSDQFHPQQNQDGDHRLVINDFSVDHGEANFTQQKVKALRSADSSTKDRLLTNGESWDPGLVAVNRSRESQSDRSSNPPEQGTFEGQQQQVLHAAQQPTSGSRGQNRLATGSIFPISVDSQLGPRHSNASGYRHSFPPGQQSMREQDSASLVGDDDDDDDHAFESSVPSAQAETDQGAPGPVLLSDLPKSIIRGLVLRLDPLKSSSSDWRELASHYKVPSVVTTYWSTMSTPGKYSPIENLIEWLEIKNKAVTVDDFMDLLKKITRFDVFNYLFENGY